MEGVLLSWVEHAARIEAEQQRPPPLQTIVVPPSLQPAPAHEGVACVYVVRWEDGYWYAGQTMHIHQRQQQHCERRGSKEVEMVYACVRDPAVARRLEGMVIRALEEAGMPMWSTHDASLSA